MNALHREQVITAVLRRIGLTKVVSGRRPGQDIDHCDVDCTGFSSVEVVVLETIMAGGEPRSTTRKSTRINFRVPSKSAVVRLRIKDGRFKGLTCVQRLEVDRG